MLTRSAWFFIFLLLFIYLQFSETLYHQGHVGHIKYIFTLKHGLCGLAHSSRNLNATTAGQAAVVLKHTLHTNARIEGTLNMQNWAFSECGHFFTYNIFSLSLEISVFPSIFYSS